VTITPRPVVAVAVGGAAGCLARHGLLTAVPTAPGGFPVGTLLVNLAGAFALGLLLEALARRGDRPLLRLGAGTGFLGAFTTYSTFAVEIDLLTRDGAAALALGYAAASLVGGVLAVAAGVGLAGVVRR
jgi:CrcB protein